MIRIWIASLALSIASASSLPDRCWAQQEPTLTTESNDDFDHLRTLLTRQVNAWNSGDLDTFMETYWQSPQLTFSSGGATTRGWQATLDRYRKRYPDKETMGKLAFDQLEFRSLGSQAALVLGQWKLTNKTGNPTGNFSLVVEKIGDRWLIVHDHSSSLPSDEKDEQK